MAKKDGHDKRWLQELKADLTKKIISEKVNFEGVVMTRLEREIFLTLRNSGDEADDRLMTDENKSNLN